MRMAPLWAQSNGTSQCEVLRITGCQVVACVWGWGRHHSLFVISLSIDASYSEVWARASVTSTFLGVDIQPGVPSLPHLLLSCCPPDVHEIHGIHHFLSATEPFAPEAPLYHSHLFLSAVLSPQAMPAYHTAKPHEDPVQIPHRSSLPASLGCFTLTQFLQRFPIWSPSFSRFPPNSGFFHFCLMPPAIPIYPLGPSSAVHGLRPYCSQGLASAPPTHAHSSFSGPRTGEPCPVGQVALVLSYLFLAFLFYLFTT